MVPPFGGVNIQTGRGGAAWPQVPPLLAHGHDPGKALLLSVNPEIVQRAAEWTEFKAPDGKSYFFSNITKQSVWEKPQPLIDLEGKNRFLL